MTELVAWTTVLGVGLVVNRAGVRQGSMRIAPGQHTLL